MNAAPLLDGPVAALARAVRDGGVSPRATIDAALAAMDRAALGPEGLNAVLWRDDAAARAEADRLAAEPRQGPLAGVPIVIKDNLATTTLPTTCGSRLLAGYVSPFEATAVTRLREAGAVVVGKANMDEFAMGSSTEHSAWGPTRNPVAVGCVPGGSSGGSAAAVASGALRVALGSDTGGSVRQPAAFCGVVGLKPTYGRVSRHGLVAFGSSLDQVGVLARDVADAAAVLQVIAGPDPLDSTSLPTPVPDLASAVDAGDRLDGTVIGVPDEYFPEALDAAIRAQCERALDLLRDRGATVRRVTLPHTPLAIPVYYVVAPAEASSNLARFDGVRYGRREVPAGGGVRELYEATRSAGFGAEVTRRILLGTWVLSAGYYDAYYRRAQAVRQRIRDDFTRVFAAGVHALFTPTTPTTAFPMGAKADPYEMYLSDIFTVTANLAGIPALSLPIGRIAGRPVGGQLLASHGDEATLLRVAAALERRLGDEAHR
jgi:aspartyl-tRNA(Asn)/glutamyl-tRNA(Gln) amidotransferase subunit A